MTGTIQLGVKKIFKDAEKLEPTKRNVLKTIASIFDPAGYLQPIVVMLKLLFQEVGLTKMKSDEFLGKRLRWKACEKIAVSFDFVQNRKHIHFYAKFIVDSISENRLNVSCL